MMGRRRGPREARPDPKERMPDTCLPETDSGLLHWATTASERLAVAAAVYGISPERASAFAVRAAEYAAALDACQPSTRTVAATMRKNLARKALKDDARLIIRTATGMPTLTPEDRLSLGLSTRGTGRRAAVPEEAPFVDVVAVSGLTVTVRVGSLTLNGQAKPAGCAGLTLFARVDDPAYPDRSAWRFVGNFGRTVIDVVFDDLAPGTRVWITAEWMNARFEPGPRAFGVHTHLQGGLSLPAGAGRVGGRSGRAMALVA